MVMDKYLSKIKTIKAPEPKSLLPWFILILAIVVGKNLLGLVKSAFGGVSDALKNEEEKGEGSGVSQDEIIVDQEKLTYPSNNYLMWADQIEQGFYATYLTEDDELIGQVLRYMQNDMDVAKLVSVYGVRDGGGWYNTNYNLPQAVSAMLDNDVKTLVNQNYQGKGMSFRF